MRFIAIKTDNGKTKGKLSFYCRMLKVSRQGFHQYLENMNKPWKYEALAQEMIKICQEDECNDTYGRIRMHQALKLRTTEDIDIPSERTVYRIMEEIGLSHTPKRKPNGITKADREARKSDDLLKRNFKSDNPLEKAVTDITEIKAKDGKLYVSAIFDCYGLTVLGLSMDTNMKASLCTNTIENACLTHPGFKYCICPVIEVHSIPAKNIARCESMWARMKKELLYGRYRPKEITARELKKLVWRYFMSYWNNRRICSANGGLPPKVKRQRYY